jgi:hypothetical protein
VTRVTQRRASGADRLTMIKAITTIALVARDQRRRCR